MVKLGEELSGFSACCPYPPQCFEYVNAAFAAFDFGNIRLRQADRLGNGFCCSMVRADR
jgi:hypothetical protein